MEELLKTLLSSNQTVGATFGLLLLSLVAWVLKKGASAITETIRDTSTLHCRALDRLGGNIKATHRQQYRLLRRNQAAIAVLVMQQIKGKDGLDQQEGERQMKTILEADADEEHDEPGE